MDVPCIYSDRIISGDETSYFCEFRDQIIPENIQIIPKGLHKGDEKSNDDIDGVVFSKCNLTKVPQGLTMIFPNMKFLIVWKSNLKDVNKNDLTEYRCIKIIGFCKTEIEFLPGDLFEGFRNIQEISFTENKLKLIEPNILDGLTKLIAVDFTNNTRYNIRFTLKPNYQSIATLQELKFILFDKFTEYHENYEFVQNHSNNIQCDIKNFLQTDENFKDFQINIDDREFLVHKFILAARSPIFAEILKNNPDAESLNLVDVSVDIFEKILNFLYNDEFSTDGIDFMDLFAAAGRLKISMLMDFSAQKLIETIDSENALIYLRMSNKYDHEELRHAAFVKIKDDYPEIEFEDEWSKDMERILKIINAYKIRVKIMRKADEDFKNYVKNC